MAQAGDSFERDPFKIVLSAAVSVGGSSVRLSFVLLSSSRRVVLVIIVGFFVLLAFFRPFDSYTFSVFRFVPFFVRLDDDALK